jgi:hypothetical protein
MNALDNVAKACSEIVTTSTLTRFLGAGPEEYLARNLLSLSDSLFASMLLLLPFSDDESDDDDGSLSMPVEMYRCFGLVKYRCRDLSLPEAASPMGFFVLITAISLARVTFGRIGWQLSATATCETA